MYVGLPSVNPLLYSHTAPIAAAAMRLTNTIPNVFIIFAMLIICTRLADVLLHYWGNVLEIFPNLKGNIIAKIIIILQRFFLNGKSFLTLHEIHINM